MNLWRTRGGNKGQSVVVARAGMVQAFAMTRFIPVSAIAVLGLLGACSQISSGSDSAPVAPAVAPAPAPAPASTAEPNQTTEVAEATEPEPEAAPAPAAGPQRLGEVTASLGDPGVSGTWLSTSLVSSAQPGRVEVTSTGQSAEVELRPAQGAATLSLSAMQALGVGLADIPTVVVYTR